MSGTPTVSVETVVERKDEALPRYVVLTSIAFGHWALRGTTVVDVVIDGETVGRRSLKRLGKGSDDWFIDLPNSVCDRLGVQTGQRVIVELSKASEETAAELSALLQESPPARRRWAGLTPSQRRALNEHVLAAKRSETRKRRAEKALLRLARETGAT